MKEESAPRLPNFLGRQNKDSRTRARPTSQAQPLILPCPAHQVLTAVTLDVFGDKEKVACRGSVSAHRCTASHCHSLGPNTQCSPPHPDSLFFVFFKT